MLWSIKRAANNKQWHSLEMAFLEPPQVLARGYVSADEDEYIPFAIYYNAAYPRIAIVSFAGGMFTRRVPISAVTEFKREILDKTRSRWMAIPTIPGPWVSTMPGQRFFHAPPPEPSYLVRNPNRNGPSLAVKLRSRARTIARTRNRKAHTRRSHKHPHGTVTVNARPRVNSPPSNAPPIIRVR